MSLLTEDEEWNLWNAQGIDEMNQVEAIAFARAYAAAIMARLASAELPEPMGYLCDWGNDSYGLTCQTVYYGEPGSAIEDDWNCHPKVHHNTKIFTADQLRQAYAQGAASQLSQEPTFFYRPTCNGEMYEGPHHARSVGGRMLREEKPTEWVELYTRREA